MLSFAFFLLGFITIVAWVLYSALGELNDDKKSFNERRSENSWMLRLAIVFFAICVILIFIK